MARKQTLAEVFSDPVVAIGSATGSGGLRERIGQHIDNPERTERATLTCECGWNHLAVSWAEAPGPQSAAYYETALLRSYFTRHIVCRPSEDFRLTTWPARSPRKKRLTT